MSLVTEFRLQSPQSSMSPSLPAIDPTYQTALNRRAAELRAQYGREGKVVYDRLDRWREEHRRCLESDHEPAVEKMMYVIHCRSMDAVAVCESWQFSS